MNTEVTCTLCQSSQLQPMLDFGLQPPSNRFVSADQSDVPQETQPLALGYCQDCDTAQLTARMPVSTIRPQYGWLNYNEPEGHLDDVARQLAALPGMNSQSRLLGITYKDQSTLNRLAQLQLPQGVCIAEADFGITDGYFGLESIQQQLRNPDTIASLNQQYGGVDLILMRHVIEHTDNATALLQQLRGLMTPGGYLVLELPDSEKIFTQGNHAFIWEEHISYYTESSLAKLAAAIGAEITWCQRYRYPYEDSLVVALRFTMTSPAVTQSSNHMRNQLHQFSQHFADAKRQWRDTLQTYQAKGEKTALFGAGHLAVKFINFLQLGDLIDCVIDDNPNKAGMKMPGSLLPIVPSTELIHSNIRVCISTLSPESEAKVRPKLATYFDQGGVWLPAFTAAIN